MTSLLKIAVLFFGLCLFLNGCKDIPSSPGSAAAKNAVTYAVVVGMETSRAFGSCPGAGVDSERMRTLLSEYATNVVYLRDANATRAAVVSALTVAVRNTGEGGLVLFYYSGHGGSQPFADTGKEEVDGSDEFLCLYDTYLRDNEIWKVISQSRGRIFMLVDACHSQTMYRQPGFKVKVPLAWDHTLTDNAGFSMLCWSGCPDDTYSYGASTGGQFTNALIRHFKKSGQTYEELWKLIKADSTLRKYENPQSTALGGGFAGKQMFR